VHLSIPLRIAGRRQQLSRSLRSMFVTSNLKHSRARHLLGSNICGESNPCPSPSRTRQTNPPKPALPGAEQSQHGVAEQGATVQTKPPMGFGSVSGAWDRGGERSEGRMRRANPTIDLSLQRLRRFPSIKSFDRSNPTTVRDVERPNEANSEVKPCPMRRAKPLKQDQGHCAEQSHGSRGFGSVSMGAGRRHV